MNNMNIMAFMRKAYYVMLDVKEDCREKRNVIFAMICCFEF